LCRAVLALVSAHENLSHLMKMMTTILLVYLAARADASAAPFAEPKPHPISRYEAGWEKNPFTLKTAPPAIIKESFAKDIALAGWRQAGDDVIVKLVNTKTKEYSSLKNNEPGPDGTRVKSAHLEGRQADMFVELERDKEPPAVVRFDEGFIRTMGAQAGAAKPGVPGQVPGRTSGAAAPMMNGVPVTNTAPPAKAAPAIAGRSTPPRPGVVPTPQLPQSIPSPGNNIPTIQRRRLNTMPQPLLPPR
jgi:hypothetical protein